MPLLAISLRKDTRKLAYELMDSWIIPQSKLRIGTIVCVYLSASNLNCPKLFAAHTT
jgi:hypothetical protein